MLSALFTVLALLGVGYLLQRTGRLPDQAADALNRIIIDVCVPATILRLVPTLRVRAELGVLVLVPWAMAALAYGIVRVVAGPLRLEPRSRTVLFIATALGNTSFLGFPLCSALLGEGSVPLAAVYDQLGSFLMLSTLAPVAIAGVTAGPRPRPAEVARRIVLFPPFVALLLALLPLPRPTFVEPLLITAATPLVPLGMIAVGLKLRLTPPRPRRALAVGLAMKLLLLPAAAWGLARALGAPHAILQVAVLETAMPTMITAGALLMSQGVMGELAAAFVGWGLVISLVTVPAWSILLR